MKKKGHSPGAWAMIALIGVYRAVLAPFVGGRCRFYPSCSVYAQQAFEIHPWWRALWLTLRRLSRCHPLGGHGVDPVPEAVRKGK